MNENKLWQPILDTSTPETIDSENFLWEDGEAGKSNPELRAAQRKTKRTHRTPNDYYYWTLSELRNAYLCALLCSLIFLIKLIIMFLEVHLILEASSVSSLLRK